MIIRSVKPHVINVFSDIALATEGDFDRYTQVILGILKQAGDVNLSPETDDDDLKDYINSLRESILQAYTGILHSSQDGVIGSLENIADFLKRSTSDPHRSTEVLKHAIGLVGDMVYHSCLLLPTGKIIRSYKERCLTALFFVLQGQIFGVKVQRLFQEPFIASMLLEGLSSSESDIRELSQWAQAVR